MINFFRKIRHKLLDEGRLRKYLVYALGEIILVMIGILLALQVNNWNENNKKKEVQLDQLSDLRTEIKSMKDFLNFQINILEISNEANKTFLGLMKPDAILTTSPDSIHILLAKIINTDLVSENRLSIETHIKFEENQEEEYGQLINHLLSWKHFAARISADFSLIEDNREENLNNALINSKIPGYMIFFDKPDKIRFPINYESLIRNDEIYAVLYYRLKRLQLMKYDLEGGLNQLDEMLSEIN